MGVHLLGPTSCSKSAILAFACARTERLPSYLANGLSLWPGLAPRLRFDPSGLCVSSLNSVMQKLAATSEFPTDGKNAFVSLNKPDRLKSVGCRKLTALLTAARHPRNAYR